MHKIAYSFYRYNATVEQALFRSIVVWLKKVVLLLVLLVLFATLNYTICTTAIASEYTVIIALLGVSLVVA